MKQFIFTILFILSYVITLSQPFTIQLTTSSYYLRVDTLLHQTVQTTYIHYQSKQTDNYSREGMTFYNSSYSKLSNSVFKNSGLDKGHLCPAEDFSYSEEALKESFSFLNVAPQHPSNNRGIWRKVENFVNNNIESEEDTLIVVTGVVFNDRDVNSKMSIPSYFYKVIFKYNSKYRNCIAFVLSNIKYLSDINEHWITVYELEQMLGYEIYTNKQFNKKKTDIDKWIF